MTVQGVLAILVRLEGGPWWRDLVGPLLLSLTAIAAAIIAARTANKRQEEQLAHDRDLQKEQLAYDREQRNRQHVRDTIDDAVRQWDNALRAIAEYESGVEVETPRLDLLEKSRNEVLSDEARSRAKKLLSEELEEIIGLKKKAQDLAVDLISTELRLILRLGEAHPIVEAFKSFRQVYKERKDLLRGVNLLTPVPEESMEGLHELHKTTTSSASDFLNACEGWLKEC